MQKVLLVCLDLTDYLGCREILAQLELLAQQVPLVHRHQAFLEDHGVRQCLCGQEPLCLLCRCTWSDLAHSPCKPAGGEQSGEGRGGVVPIGAIPHH